MLRILKSLIILTFFALPFAAGATALVTGPSGGFITLSNGSALNLPSRQLAGATYNIVCEGDSITVNNIGGNNAGYCRQLSAALLANRGITATWKAMGISGISWNFAWSGQPPGLSQQTLNTFAPSQVDTEIDRSKTNILVMFAGSNGMWSTLGNHSAATEFSDFQTNYNARIAAGWVASNIIVVTTLPRQDSSSFDTTRGTYNASLKTFCASNGCAIADAGGNPTIGCNGCEDNASCFLLDKIHLSDTGTCGSVSGGGMNYLATQLLVQQVP